MDLALELGSTAEVLADTMSEREFRRWYLYARKRWLPGQRVELLLANIARMTAGSDSIAPFIFDPLLRDYVTPKPVATAAIAASAFAAMTGTGRVFRLGQKRKKVANG